MSTGPEHYTEAERLLAQADGQYLDASTDAAPREHYASDEDWVRAMAESAEAHELSIRTAALFAQMAAGHATLALAAATAPGAAATAYAADINLYDVAAWERTAGSARPVPDEDEDPDDGFTAADLHEMDQRDEAALDAAAEAGESR